MRSQGFKMTVVSKQEENTEAAHECVLISEKGREKQTEIEKKKRDRYTIMHQGRALEKKTKNTFIFTTIITGYIICVFLCVASWGHIEKENKGKKREFKNNRFAKNSEERYYPVKGKEKK